LAFHRGHSICGLPAFSQSEEDEVSVQAFGGFVKRTTSDGIQTYRCLFGVHNRVELNMGMRNAQNFLLSSGALGVKTYSHQMSWHTYSAFRCAT
jgi:hypothetical protein